MRFAFAVAAAMSILLFPAGGGAIAAEPCPGAPHALGTSRVVAIDPATLPRIGFMQYKEMVELQPKEVILTFDDGPLPKTTTAVLETLRKECVKATFFIVGRMAKAYPNVLREVAADGHSIATHSVTHPLIFPKQSFEKGKKEIDDGFTIVNDILAQDGRQAAPWFRFPGLGRTNAFEKYLAERGVVAMSADFPVDDWLHRTPDQVYNIALARLEANGKGMFLLHDIQPSTVAMLPRLLRTLKQRGYKVVHMVPLGTSGVDVARVESRTRVPLMPKQPVSDTVPATTPAAAEPVQPNPPPRPASSISDQTRPAHLMPLPPHDVVGSDMMPLRRDEMPFSVFWPSQVINDLRSPTMR
ncbi:MAG: polysaccharide deacetylase family protein [Bacteroidales bacterium]|nr:polysaccharide deacetylase family protein [Bacteroidales bacterium]